MPVSLSILPVHHILNGLEVQACLVTISDIGRPSTSGKPTPILANVSPWGSRWTNFKSCEYLKLCERNVQRSSSNSFFNFSPLKYFYSICVENFIICSIQSWSIWYSNVISNIKSSEKFKNNNVRKEYWTSEKTNEFLW